MTAYGTVYMGTLMTPLSAGAYGLETGRFLSAISGVYDFGGGGGSVDPKRFLNVGGTAVPIQ